MKLFCLVLIFILSCYCPLADGAGLLAPAGVSEYDLWQDQVEYYEAKFVNISCVLPGIDILVFDWDNFMGLSMRGLPARKRKNIIAGREPMPAKYILSPVKYVLLKKFFQGGGKLVIISGSDITSLHLRLGAIFPPNLRENIIVGHCHGNQVYRYDSQGSIKKIYDASVEYLGEIGFSDTDIHQLYTQWRSAVNKSIEFFELDRDYFDGAYVGEAGVAERTDGLFGSGSLAQITYSFESRQKVFSTAAAKNPKVLEFVEHINDKIGNFNMENDGAHLPLIQPNDENKYVLRYAVEKYLKYFFENTQVKHIKLSQLIGTKSGVTSMDTGIANIDKAYFVRKAVDLISEHFELNKVDCGRILFGEDNAENLVQMIGAVKSLENRCVINTSDVRGLLIPQTADPAASEVLNGDNSNILVIDGFNDPSCSKLTEYFIENSIEIPNSQTIIIPPNVFCFQSL